MVLPGAVETARLPKEFQEVKYIRSSGTQYIDTGVIPTVNTGARAVGYYATMANGDNIIIGASNATAFAGGKPFSIDPQPNLIYFPFGGFVPNSTDTLTITQSTNMVYEYTLNYKDSGIASVDDTQLTLPSRTSMTSKSLYLFCLNGNGTAGYFSSFTMMEMEITEGQEVIRHLIPCYRKSDTAIGLYDLVNGVFYTNAGTGTFAKGADVSDSGSSGELFEFTYSGNFTDNRDADGKGTVRLNTSGTLTVSNEPITIIAKLVGAGGGGVYVVGGIFYSASGGGGGIQDVQITLLPGTYEIVIGTGGAGFASSIAGNATGGTGGDTTAFGATSTGGTGASVKVPAIAVPGVGGTPNGENGRNGTTSGGSPNGGSSTSESASGNSGGDGYVELTFI